MFKVAFLSSAITLTCFVSAAAGIPVWSLEDFQKQIDNNTSDTTFVVNFWATWCKPCVQELPEFEKLEAEFRVAGLRKQVVLVSLDFKKDIDAKLGQFVKSKSLRSRVILFSEARDISWIDSVSTEWSGAIPATLVINNKKKIRLFFERQFTFEELKAVISPIDKEEK